LYRTQGSNGVDWSNVSTLKAAVANLDIKAFALGGRDAKPNPR